MGKLWLGMLCFGMTLGMALGLALGLAASANARGTYHHSEPYYVQPDPHRTHGWAPVVGYSPEHGHYHLTHHPH